MLRGRHNKFVRFYEKETKNAEKSRRLGDK